MKLLILGAGAMGSLFAGKLKQAGMDVTLYNRSNDHTRAIQNNGLTLTDTDGNASTAVLSVVTNPAGLTDNYDLVLVLVKAFATQSVLKNVLPALHKNTPILTLQNGIGNMEKIERLAPAHDVMVGGTRAGAGIKEPGVVVHRAWGSTFIGVSQPGDNQALLDKIALTFSASGLETHVSENVQSIVWSKLLVNVAYNGLTAVTRLKNGDTLLVQEGEDIVAKLVHEAVQIAKAKKIPLLFDDPAAECIRLGKVEIGMNTSSMLTDVLHERKTEIDVMNGAVVEEGRKHRIPTPYNDMMTKLIKVMENTYQHSVHLA
ncbi:2-dehydropantoate 2-reductase [Lentibacillus halodurans]|uniref:2-dehydropantoate 2-reductase n=2 Tax=Lentibacillus halodurans TaxID=237679 RepID=A0A1I0W1M1_9BACI|nr:2-dehydropantoate 2-reductase [Lentibacillus halodurans]SFA82444.1 2-dehydropantoate 2-reductase [Lentibacillus halodurans]